MSQDTNNRRAVAHLIREYLRVLRDLSAARALLQICAQKQLCPTGWEQQLETMRRSPAYQESGQPLELIASRLEQSAEEIDLNELLEKLPKESPIN